jgi:protein phosphatase 1G
VHLQAGLLCSSCFQEDAHVAQLNFGGKDEVAFFGVFDGHGGAQVAKFCAMHMPDELLRSSKYKAGDIEGGLKQTYLGIDDRLRSKDNIELLNQLREKTTSSGTNGIGIVEPVEQDPASGVLV